MWPLRDPITGAQAVLVTEQNISQVKSVEEQYSQQKQRLEARLQEALAVAANAASRAGERPPGAVERWAAGGGPSIEIDTPAERTLQLLDRLLGGEGVTMDDVAQLRDTIVGATDLVQPLNLNEQVLRPYEAEVGASLLQLLSSRPFKEPSESCSEEDERTSPSTPGRSEPLSGVSSSAGSLVHGGLDVASLASVNSLTMYQPPATGAPAGPGGAPAAPPSGGGGGGSLSSGGASGSSVASGRSGGMFAAAAAAFTSQQQATAAAAAAAAAERPDQSAARELLAAMRALSVGGGLPVGGDLALLGAACNSWQFDSFQLSSVLGGRPLSALGFYVFKRSNLVDKFNLDEVRLARFLNHIEDGYPANPYHNRTHAADVLRSMHLLATRGGVLQPGGHDDLVLLACYLAAIVHDYEHRGLNNDYLVRTSDSLALLYNDRSPMENHHLAASWQLLVSEDYNFLRRLPHKQKEALRKLVIDMVLATDMKQHFSIQGLFQAKIHHQNSSMRPQASSALSSVGSGSAGTPTTPGPVVGPGGGATPARGGGGSRGAGGGGGGGGGNGGGGRHAEDDAPARGGAAALDDESRSLNLQVALKVADLGHLATPPAVHRKWVQCLEEEFFRQGDRERAAGLPVSPLMDREKAGISKSQLGFFDVVALPLFQTFTQRFPESEPLLAAVRDNHNAWMRETASASAAAASAAASASGGSGGGGGDVGMERAASGRLNGTHELAAPAGAAAGGGAKPQALAAAAQASPSPP